MANRLQVIDAIASERDYQKRKWGEKPHSLPEWFMYMEDYINEAKHILSRESDETANPKALDIMRKVTSMGVAAMEQHGAPKRA